MAAKTPVLSEITIYPVKSLQGIQLSSAEVLFKGLKYDRRYMLVTEDGTAITQREHPRLCLFKTAISGDSLQISMGTETIVVPLVPHNKANGKPVRIWDDTVTAVEPDTAASHWFTGKLGIECHLVFFPEANPRQVDEKFRSNDEHVSLADAFPLLLISQASLNDLNSRLAEPLGMERFRPNIVVTGTEPYEEDNWAEFSIGSAGFAAVKPCARCILTTVDPRTATHGKEPLKTLATYRTRNNKIYYGQNVLVLKEGEIKKGEAVSVASNR